VFSAADHARNVAMNQAVIGVKLARPGRSLYWARQLHYHVLIIEEPGAVDHCRVAFSPEILEAEQDGSLVRILRAIRFLATVRSGKTLLVHRDGNRMRFDLLEQLPG